jgi:MmyB-like transcription regulator ligand binding domain
VIQGHEPYPALAIDRRWTLLTANDTAKCLMGGVSPELLQPPVNVLRLSLHPAGLSRQIVNLSEWRTHILARLRRQLDITADPGIDELLRENQELSGIRCHRQWIVVISARLWRRRDSPASEHARWCAELLLHDNRVRHARGHHALGDRSRSVLPGRYSNGRGAATQIGEGETSMRQAVHHVVDAELVGFVGQIDRPQAPIGEFPVLGNVVIVIGNDDQAP